MELGVHFDFADLSLGWREILLALVFLLAMYMLFELLRLRWLRKRRDSVAAADAIEPVLTSPKEAIAAYTAEEQPAPGVAWSEAGHLAQESFMRGVEYEMAQMRDEIDAVRSEFAVLREQLQQEMTRLRAAQTVSPFYNDAMQMAAAGHDSALIAERCGISRAEADLVVALVNQPEQTP